MTVRGARQAWVSLSDVVRGERGTSVPGELEDGKNSTVKIQSVMLVIHTEHANAGRGVRSDTSFTMLC